MKNGKISATIGRPRAFDADKALDRALKVFWQKGYEGSALSDLTKAMGINRPSLYAAFGNKKALFGKALDRYSEARLACLRKALSQPTARAAVERLLIGAADMSTDRSNPHGCLMVQGALACGEAADGIRKELGARRAAAEAAIRKRLLRAKKEGDLPTSADPNQLARYISTVIHGIAVQAASGATRADLRRVVETALRAWPQ
jgi:AcrR family transcriptional regulator